MQSLSRGNPGDLSLFSTALLAFALFGCAAYERAGSADVPRAVPPTIWDSAGVTIVENLEPQWGPGSEWRIGSLLTSIGETDGDPAHELLWALDAVRLSDGTVAVGNSSSGEIRFFSPNGTFLRKAGSTGGGPGEFRGSMALRELERVAGDTLLAWDIYAQTVSIFAPDGAFVRSFRLDGPAQQHFFVGSFADRSLLLLVYEPQWSGGAENMPEGLTRRNVTLHHYGADHRLADSRRDISGSDLFQARWGQWGMMSTEPPFGRTTSIQAGGSRIYVATGDADEISVYDPSGQLKRSIRRGIGPTPVTPGMIRRDREGRVAKERAQMEESSNIEPRVLRMIDELPYPDLLPPYGRALLDSELNLWVEEFRVAGDDPAVWSVFDEEGVWLGRVTLPQGLKVYEIGTDYVLGRSLNEMEVERIQVYELIKSWDVQASVG